MKELKDTLVGKLVAQDYRYADVFKKHHIDFCCGGGITIEEACHKKGLDQKELVRELEAVITTKPEYSDLDNGDVEQLIDHIIHTHHVYVRENIPLLISYATKVAQVHGDNHPETKRVEELVRDLANELAPHLEKEEVVLFPYIKDLIKAKKERIKPASSPFGTVRNPVTVMMAEHDAAGDILKELSSVTSDYTPPADACTTFSVLYLKLKEFENDLHRHIHLENNVLFPKAVDLEKVN